MRIIVIGGGVIGCTSAYWLRLAGHEVALVEQEVEAGHGRTECKVGANSVSICGISCQSNACLKENPARYTPTWPLAGGPNSAALPASPGSGTLAPAN